MEPVSKTLTVFGDSSNGIVSGIAAGKGRIITVTVFNSARNKWCIGKDTVDINKNLTSFTWIKLKQVQPNYVTDDTIHGHILKADEIWRGTCFLRGDITVPSGIELTIVPGSTIRVATSNLDQDSGTFAKGRVEIYGSGTFTARGDANHVITFTSDSASPKVFAWWGIGWGYGAVNMAYCSISSTDYGVFFMTNSIGSVENFFISHAQSGIVDYGDGCSCSKITFSEVKFPISISGGNKSTDISLCDFPEGSLVDVKASGSNQTISVRNCNFKSTEYYNLYSEYGSMITANNCYNIYKVKDSTGAVLITNQADSSIPDAGCGFTVPQDNGYNSLNKKVMIYPGEPVKKILEIREMNSKSLSHWKTGINNE